ncbi:DUF1801 domain-containing protein [Kordiimonas sp. SCSIO 12603]|uniref:DUF1801 domain-containing protein n=1 Tax=Kordiimonas sp. SCSIO 12603 TaxID=2829596 RepID=UPI002102E7EA|nr:DUF1801 domain-containing protein [Kordiimonas sp. SCSIO 12603]UTW58580.1 DUF1801 domain-containing protein [Kordiimonas sp. SCSIO 12603]
MAELKTKENDASVEAFLEAVEHKKRREDALVIKEVFDRITSWPAKMWGASIVGYGSYDYKYPTGRTGTWMITGFSPRKTSLTLYIMPGFGRYEELMSRLGKYKTGKSCLYVNKLEDVDMEVLEELIKASVQHMVDNYHKDNPVCG